MMTLLANPTYRRLFAAQAIALAGTGLSSIALAVAVAAGAIVIVNTAVYVRDRLGGAESDTALAFAAAGAGSMAVAPLLSRLLEARADRPFMLAGGRCRSRTVIATGMPRYGTRMPALSTITIRSGREADLALPRAGAGAVGT